MADYVFTDVVFVGDKREVRSLYGKMKRLEERKAPLVENGFYTPNSWLGNLVVRLGGNWQDVYCRGTWDSLRMRGKELSFFTETASKPPFGVFKLIQECYPSLQFYFEAKGDWDSYVTNDAEGRYFTSRYVVDCEPDMEYFDTIEEACSHLSRFIDQPIEPSWQALYAAAETWNDDNEDASWPVDVKQIEVIGNDELW